MKKFKLAVIVGRFEPYHIGHEHLYNHALNVAEKVLIIVGSANRPRCIANPLSFIERASLIKQSYSYEPHRTYVAQVNDCISMANWEADIRDLILSELYTHWNDAWENKDVALVGYQKDDSSYYLNNFPEYSTDLLSESLSYCGQQINATDIRELAFTEQPIPEKLIPDGCSNNFLDLIPDDDDVAQLKREHQFIEDYKAQWINAPFAPTFNCSDAVVVQSGHVLLIKRKFEPGKGLYALPGGFIEQNETAFDAAVREAHEETQIKVQPEIFRRALKNQRVFDSPSRSKRGRTFSHAFYFELAHNRPLPHVRGADDGEKAFWMPLNQFFTDDNRAKMYEDHFDIVDFFVQ